MDNEQNLESNYAIYTVFGTDIVEELCNTEFYGECRFKPKGKVRISPLTGMVGLKDEIGNLNVINEPYDCATDTIDTVRFLIESKDIEHKDFGLIDPKDFSENELELIDFSEPKPELELIDFREFSKPEPESIDFSDSEPELEYLPKPKAIEIDMPLRVCIERSDIIKKEIGSESNDKVGISLFVTPNFSKLEALPNSKNVFGFEIFKTDSFFGTEISSLSNSKKKDWVRI